jgi:hypothetical protein
LHLLQRIRAAALEGSVLIHDGGGHAALVLPVAWQGCCCTKARRAAGSRLIRPVASRSHVAQRTAEERVWPPTERALLVCLLERLTFRGS